MTSRCAAVCPITGMRNHSGANHVQIGGIKGDRLLSSSVITFACMKALPCRRAQQAGFIYHVINRGNGRATISDKAQDYQVFLSILALAKRGTQLRCLLSL